VELRDRLRTAAARRREAERELAERTAELRAAIVEAHASGVPVAVIARTTGLSRNSVYAHLRAAGRR
jgi:DNA-directed RNA polymerase specialized sigma24 family protein